MNKTTQEKIRLTSDNHRDLVLEKNRRYGDSALSPLGIFGKHVSPENSQALNGILVRLDDKLSRIKNAGELRKNDIADLRGYLTLLCVDKDWINFDDLLD